MNILSNPWVWGAGVLVVLEVLYALLARTLNPLFLADGEDGQASTSKLQFLLWTVAIIFSYAVLAVARYERNEQAAIAIPQNLMLVMGFSIGTALLAKGIRMKNITDNKAVAGMQPARFDYSHFDLGYVITDYSGMLDLTKCQMLAWTLIAIGVYLGNVAAAVGSAQAPSSLPDIDQALLVLMGFSQGTYLLKKAMASPLREPAALPAGPAAPPRRAAAGPMGPNGGGQAEMLPRVLPAAEAGGTLGFPTMVQPNGDCEDLTKAAQGEPATAIK